MVNIHQLHKASFIHQLHKVSFIYCFLSSDKILIFNLLKNDSYQTKNKKCIKNTNTVSYEIKYITTQSINNQNIDGKVSLCLRFTDVDVYFIEENENKYLVFALRENNKEVLEL